MAKKKFNALPEAARKILMAASGEATSRQYGVYWMTINADSRKDYAGKPGHTIAHLSPEEQRLWHPRLQAIVDRWVAADPQRGKVLAAFHKELDAIEASR